MSFFKNFVKNFTIFGLFDNNKSPHIPDQNLWNRLGEGAAPGNYEGIDPETGAYKTLPDGRIAAQAQHNVNRFMWRRRDRLYASATNTMDNALGTLESWRPGGAAALTSGLYQGKAQTQMARAQATTPLDQLYWDRRDSEMRARKAAEKNAWIGAAGNVIGMAVGGALGGGGGGFLNGLGQGVGGAVAGGALQQLSKGAAPGTPEGQASNYNMGPTGSARSPQIDGSEYTGPTAQGPTGPTPSQQGAPTQPGGSGPGPQMQGNPSGGSGSPAGPGGAPAPSGGPGGAGAGGPGPSSMGDGGGVGGPEAPPPGAQFNPAVFAEQRNAQYGGALDDAYSQAMVNLQQDGFWETRLDSINRMSMEIEDEDWELMSA